jgi:trimeric autotransporter adhesin
MKKLFFLTTVLFLIITEGRSQSVGINFNGASPNAAAALDIDVSALGTKKGLLIPRMNQGERTGMTLSAPAQGLLVYQTDLVQGFYYNTSTTTTPNWIYLSPGGSGTRWDQIAAPAANLNLGHGTYNTIMTFDGVTNASALAISSNSLTSGDLLHLNVTSTAAPASGQVGVLSVNKSGALTNSNVTSAGVYSSVTNTGGATINTGGYFFASGASVDNNAVYATTDANNGRGVVGENSSSGTGTQYGIYGRKIGNTGTGSGYGVFGTATGSGTNNYGGSFFASGGTNNFGVRGITDMDFGKGVYGENTSSGNGVQYGIYASKSGNSTSGSGIGIYSTAQGTGFQNDGASIYATGATNNYGVEAVASGVSATINIGGSFYAAGASGTNVGVQGLTDANFGKGVNGVNYSNGAGVQYGVYAAKTGNTGTGSGIGIYATAQGTGAQNDGASIYATGASTNYGVEAIANGAATKNVGGTFYAAGGTTTNIGLQGTTDANGGWGIFGSNYSNASGLQYGIYGTKIGNTGTGNGYAIYGDATGTGSVNYGGFFHASGASSNIGVEGTSDANNGTGVFGLNNSSGTGNQRGVWGSTNGGTGAGTGYAIYGTALGTASVNVGGYFTASGATANFAALFDQGNVGIGVNVPLFKLDVSERIMLRQNGTSTGGVNSAGLWLYQTTPASTRAFIGMEDDNNVGFFGSTWGLTMNVVTGNVGIGGCTAPQYKLHVIGDIASSGTVRTTNALVTGAITACSDIRYKKNVAPLQNALQNVLKIQGVTYNWKTKEFPDKNFNDQRQIGVIAQELEKIYPELVMTDKDGYKSVDYSKITPVLIEAIKDQQKEINTLTERLNKLEQMMNNSPK